MVQISFFSQRYRKQVLAAVTANTLFFAHGFGLGWMSPILEILKSAETPLNFRLTVEQVSWVGSLFGLGFFCGNIIFFFSINHLSRKFNLCAAAIPLMIYWILSYFAQSAEYLYVARFSAGLTGGGLLITLPLYLSEILDKDIRGSLMSMGMLSVGAGLLVGFILPTKLEYHITPCIGVIFPIAYFVLICFFPEPPQSLLKRNLVDEAEKSFNFYKAISKQSQPQPQTTSACVIVTTDTALPKTQTDEFEELKAIILSAESTRKVTYRDYVAKSSLQPFANAIVLSALYQFSGSFAYMNYMNSIFAVSGSSIDPSLATIFVGVVQILGFACATIIAERFSRRSLLFSSVIGMTIGMLAFGMFVQFTNAEMKARFNWAPLVFMVILIFSLSYGLFGQFMTILVEILPAKIRSHALSICMCFVSIFSFMVLKLYPLFLFELGISATMYTTAAMTVITSVYLYIFLPETKGKSMDAD